MLLLVTNLDSSPHCDRFSSHQYIQYFLSHQYIQYFLLLLSSESFLEFLLLSRMHLCILHFSPGTSPLFFITVVHIPEPLEYSYIRDREMIAYIF